MAPKRLQQYPPNVCSSTEEEDEEVSDENNVVAEDDDVTDAVNNQQYEDEDDADEEEEVDDYPKTQVAAENRTNSSSDFESDIDSDETPPSPNVSDFKIKPIASKPMSDPAKPKKIEPKPNPGSPPPRTNSGLKRIIDSDITGKQSSKRKKTSNNGEGDKRKKVVNGGKDEDQKKGSGFHLQWSDDDEIALLKGMADYQSKNGAVVFTDMGAFHEFIQKSLQVDVSKSKLSEKIKRLKKKFKTNVEKWENGGDSVFSKAHELKSYELSKKLWGLELDQNADDSKKVKKARQTSSKPTNSTSANVALLTEEQDVNKHVVLSGDIIADASEFSAKHPHLSEFLDTHVNFGPTQSVKALIRERMNLVEATKANEFEVKCRKLKVLELELLVRKADLVRELTKSTMDAI